MKNAIGWRESLERTALTLLMQNKPIEDIERELGYSFIVFRTPEGYPHHVTLWQPLAS